MEIPDLSTTEIRALSPCDGDPPLDLEEHKIIAGKMMQP